ncbi:piggyBac transposable element-derived protein 4 [Trichonephila clavipes]|nr:piggyBac transposable element-derived protein 4 [Trichonephila clavipes]
MGGVDRFDQRKEIYQIRRSVKGWHRIFYLLVDLTIINSFIRWKGGPASFQAKKWVVPDDVSVASVGNHMPKMVSNYRQCRKCSRKGQEKRTR